MNTEELKASSTMIINGRTVDLLDLQPDDVPQARMIRGLHGIIRFNGYSGWSVAQHSFLLSLIAENVGLQICSIAENKKGSPEGETAFRFLQKMGFRESSINNERFSSRASWFVSAMLAYDALVHDFTEALTGDIIRPFKKLVPEIGQLEEKVDRRIRQIHGAMPAILELTDMLDKQLATVEAYYLSRFHEKNLINENEGSQIRAFNSVFFETYADCAFLCEHIFGFEKESAPLLTPISNRNLFAFLQKAGSGLAADHECGQASNFDALMMMPDNLLIRRYVERCESLKERLRSGFGKMKVFLNTEADCFDLYVAEHY